MSAGKIAGSLREFVSHKRVRAGRILAVAAHDLTVERASGRPVTVVIPPGLFSRYDAVPGDYFVIYPDGWASVSPAKAFEDGYTAAA